IESQTPRNPLGVKGAGEGGTLPAAAAVALAIEDALKPFGIKVTHLPLTPERVAGLVQAASAEQRRQVDRE
ncbi:MAG: hypothetical protein KGJ86_18990, partial [Chloroflexota bacterium]|nr:hypothetical protein [Chloroflexota bacterium]